MWRREFALGLYFLPGSAARGALSYLRGGL